MVPASQETYLKAYDEHAEALYRHCYFRVYSKERAEELVQETFVKVWEYLQKGHEVENLRAFLYRVATNLIIDDSRKKKETRLDDILEDAPSLEPRTDGRHTIETALMHKTALEVMQELSDDYREVLTMRYVDDLDVSEIAETLGITPNNVSVRLNRATNALRSLFSRIEEPVHPQPENS